MDIKRDFYHTSNIIFSNGQLDPWSTGGVTQNVSAATTVIIIAQAAHHLDLRTPNPLDPQPVIDARTLETSIIQGWINEYNSIIKSPRDLVQ